MKCGECTTIHIWRKVVCLFCLSHWNLPWFFLLLLLSLEILVSIRVALSWFHNVLTYDEKVVEYPAKFSLKINLNKKNYNGIWACCWYCWKTFIEQDIMKVIGWNDTMCQGHQGQNLMCGIHVLVYCFKICFCHTQFTIVCYI